MDCAIRELSKYHTLSVIGPAQSKPLLPDTVRAYQSIGQGALSYLLCALPLAILAALRMRPDVVLAGSGLTAPVARLIALIFRAPYAVMVHGLDIIVEHTVYQRLFVPCLHSADSIIANSEHTRTLALGAGIANYRIRVLHPGVEFPPPDAHGFRANLGIAPERPLLLSVGRIVARKGLPAFIEHTLVPLTRRYPELIFAVVGEEPRSALVATDSEFQRVRDTITRCRMERHVMLCGRLDDNALQAAYREADALVFPVLDTPGDVEGFGMVAVEAAAHGLPTFAFRVGGVPNAILDGVTGELAPAGNYNVLTAKLAEYIASAFKRQYAAQCLIHACANSWSIYGRRMSDILVATTERTNRGRSSGYQYGYSTLHPKVNDPISRERKAATALAVIQEHLGRNVAGLHIADIGGSGGVMAAHFAREGAIVTVVDIDEAAIDSARARLQIENLKFRVGDAMCLDFPDESQDIVLCCHVYEHVPDSYRMMSEIRRILKAGGICYFSAGNRFTWREPHYGLPLLSVMPPFLAHYYLRLMRRGHFYHERHLGYYGLRHLVAPMRLHDYTRAIVTKPEKYHASYMIRPDSLTQHAAAALLVLVPQLFPNFIWLLEKPAPSSAPVKSYHDG